MPLDRIARLIDMTARAATDAIEDAANLQRGLIGRQKQLHGVETSLEQVPREEQQRALVELQTGLSDFRRTLTPTAAALLDHWLDWAAQHRGKSTLDL
ncbi:MAG: hypothetical protein ABIX28_19960 [Vicinamibacterales bacterium]